MGALKPQFLHDDATCFNRSVTIMETGTYTIFSCLFRLIFREIHAGIALRPVSMNAQNDNNNVGSREDVMAQIRQGANLKPVGASGMPSAYSLFGKVPQDWFPSSACLTLMHIEVMHYLCPCFTGHVIGRQSRNPSVTCMFHEATPSILSPLYFTENPLRSLAMYAMLNADVLNCDVDKVAIENRKSTPNITDVGGIAGALARALEERRRNMHNSDALVDGVRYESEAIEVISGWVLLLQSWRLVFCRNENICVNIKMKRTEVSLFFPSIWRLAYIRVVFLQ
uniref:WH2 domain-containing protein n=1 Tax=Parascaris equorum TaxID=6256 RepID=A0A914R858_PAREQ